MLHKEKNLPQEKNWTVVALLQKRIKMEEGKRREEGPLSTAKRDAPSVSHCIRISLTPSRPKVSLRCSWGTKKLKVWED